MPIQAGAGTFRGDRQAGMRRNSRPKRGGGIRHSGRLGFTPLRTNAGKVHREAGHLVNDPPEFKPEEGLATRATGRRTVATTRFVTVRPVPHRKPRPQPHRPPEHPLPHPAAQTNHTRRPSGRIRESWTTGTVASRFQPSSLHLQHGWTLRSRSWSSGRSAGPGIRDVNFEAMRHSEPGPVKQGIPAQNSPTTWPSARKFSKHSVSKLMFSLMKRTEPSPIRKCAPPSCELAKPQA